MDFAIRIALAAVLCGALAGLVAALKLPRWTFALALALGLAGSRLLAPAAIEKWGDLTASSPAQKFQRALVKRAMADPVFVEWSKRQASKDDAFAAGVQLGARGTLRLPDDVLVRRSASDGAMLERATDDLCARFAGGEATSADADAFMALVRDEDVDVLVDATIRAMVAEIQDTPPVIVPTDAQVQEAFAALRDVDGPGYELNVLPMAGPGASGLARCNLLRFVYRRLPAVPEQHRGTLARVARM